MAELILTLLTVVAFVLGLGIGAVVVGVVWQFCKAAGRIERRDWLDDD